MDFHYNESFLYLDPVSCTTCHQNEVKDECIFFFLFYVLFHRNVNKQTNWTNYRIHHLQLKNIFQIKLVLNDAKMFKQDMIWRTHDKVWLHKVRPPPRDPCTFSRFPMEQDCHNIEFSIARQNHSLLSTAPNLTSLTIHPWLQINKRCLENVSLVDQVSSVSSCNTFKHTRTIFLDAFSYLCIWSVAKISIIWRGWTLTSSDSCPFSSTTRGRAVTPNSPTTPSTVDYERIQTVHGKITLYKKLLNQKSAFNSFCNITADIST